MSPSPSRLHCLAVCSPGLDVLAAGELTALGLRVRRELVGGVEMSATVRQLYAANLWCRTVTRVLVRVASFRAERFDELAKEVGQVAWEQWLGEGVRPDLRVSSTASRLYHTEAVADAVADVMATRLTAMASPRAEEAPSIQVVVRIMHDRVLISVDSSGEPLFKRGWRADGGKAPLRETLAAAALMASGWDRTSPLVDPMCGSGTLPIEAALLACGAPPGGRRSFGFAGWPTFEPGTWASVVGEAQSRVAAVAAARAVPPIVARDRDAGAVARTAANAAQAGVAELIEPIQGSVSDLGPVGTRPGWVVTNPPYGHRLANGSDLRDLYARFGQRARQALGGWGVALLAPPDAPTGQTGLPLRECLRTTNGGLTVRLLVAQVAPVPTADEGDA
jgi:putative N6-adenine-specific DNA methylase